MRRIDPEHWDRLRPIFEEALTLPQNERERWLYDVCRGDRELRAAIERMLRKDAEQSGPLDTLSDVFLNAIRQLSRQSSLPFGTAPPMIPLVGRTAEMDVLRNAVATTAAGGCAVVFVEGRLDRARPHWSTASSRRSATVTIPSS